jgi:signal transduction histidine kinase
MSQEDKSDFEVRRQLLQMEMLYEIGVALNESLDPSQVAEEILQRALVMVDARSAMLLFRGEGSAEIVGRAGSEEGADELLNLPEVTQAWSSSEPLTATRNATSWQNLCIIPLLCQQHVEGLLVVADREARGAQVGPFTDNDQALLQSFAYQAGAAMHNARLHHDLEDAYEELKEAQRKLAKLEQLRALGDLAADMVHSMGHYMGIISGRAEMFLSFGKEPEKNMQAVLETAEEGKEVIERIRMSTRLGVGKERVAASLSDLARQSVEDIRVLWEERTSGTGPAVKWELELGALEDTYLNPTDVKEVLNNLLLNALEAMPDGGPLKVAAMQRGAEVGFQVTDSGTGIDEDVQSRILEPFFTTKEDVGTGLGLSIVYRIIEDHGGALEIDSTPGQGSTFQVYLPIVTTPPPDAAEEELDG